ncbi:MAG: heme-copper oxidase subunit III [Pyrinomonadaceae bacterium]
MEIGTIETIEDDEKKPRGKGGGLRPGRGSGKSSGGNSGGGDDGGNGGGGDNKEKKGDSELQQPNPEIAQIFVWFLLLVVLMTFGGLVAAYIVLATNKSLEWNPFQLPGQVWFSTIVLILSSFVYHFAYKNIENDNYKKATNYLIATAGLGALFIASQMVVWLELANRGVYLKGNPYAGLFYVLTAVHAVHVLGGIIALGYILTKTMKGAPSPRFEKKRKQEAKSVGLYWHAMDALWLFLVFLLGFWR